MSRVYFGGLSHKTNEEDLRDFLHSFPSVSSVTIKPNGFGFVVSFSLFLHFAQYGALLYIKLFFNIFM